MKQRSAKLIASTLIALMVGSGLCGLYIAKGESQRIWPFPRTARLLLGISEFIVWAAVVVAVLFSFFIIFAKLFKAAGWWKPSAVMEKRCYRCNGTGKEPCIPNGVE